MFKKPITLEITLYILAVVIALSLRFINLGAQPLSDYEADFALQSLGIANGTRTALSGNTGYVHLTTILFFIFGGTNFLARFWPALAGTGLILAPWFVRKRIGRIPALVLAFGLALDPGLNAISRLAGGSMLAIAFLALTIVLWLDGHHTMAGIFAGLAILSGPSIWFGILSLLLAWGILQLLPVRLKGEVSVGGESGSKGFSFRSPETRRALLWGVGTFLVAGSLLVLSPLGLSSFIQSFLDFLRSWVNLSGVPLGRAFLAIPAYELLPLLFGLICLVRGFIKRDPLAIRLSLWMLAALLLVLICVGRQTVDLCWALLPLWALAAMELGRYFELTGANRWVVAAVITFIFVLLILAWLTLMRLNILDPLATEARLQWIFIGGIFLVIAISLILVGTGWTVKDAQLGGAWGVLLPLVLFTFAMTTGSAGLRDPRTLELWNPETRLGRADLVVKVANDLSFLNTGADNSLPLTIVGVDSPAMGWLFRNWEVEESDILDPTKTPELIITPLITDLTLTAEYRGEQLVWREMGDWYNATFANWLNWYIYRQMPVQREDIILWVRSDLMLEIEDTTEP